jgi:hypothetical protein
LSFLPWLPAWLPGKPVMKYAAMRASRFGADQAQWRATKPDWLSWQQDRGLTTGMDFWEIEGACAFLQAAPD